MKIAINVLPLSTHIAGAQRYTKSIIEGLVEIDTTNDYYLILSPQNAQHYGIKQANVHNVIVNVNTNIILWRIAYEQCILPLKLKQLGINVLFSPCNIAPFWKVCRYVTMIFDMHWFIEQKNLAKYRLIYIKTMICASATRSDVILTISESSKNDILYFTGVDSQKVVVTFLGATPLFDLRDEIRSHSQIERIREEKGIYKDYILFIGQVLPRKNVELLIKAMEQMRNSTTELYFQYVIAGSWGVTNDAYQTVVSLIRESSLEEDVVMVEHPDDRIVADLLAHARLFVYPSRYEGYGLPVAEALYYGIPTITSNCSSLPEVGLDACRYIDPESVDEMVQAIEDLWSNESECQKMVEKGYDRIAQLDWNESIQKTHTILLSTNS